MGGLRIGLFAVGCLGLVALAFGGEETRGMYLPAGYLFESVGEGDARMRAVVYRPEGLEGDGGYPTILFLHGYGECGRDGSKQLTAGLPVAVMLEPERWPFLIVMPQKPEGHLEWEDYEAQVLELLDLAVEKHGADPERIAITGLSQGGHGTMAIASRHPERFVCAAPVCGYVERWNTDGAKKRRATHADSVDLSAVADGLSGLPVWLFHGENDDIVLPGESRILHDALQERGGDSRLTVYPGKGHNSWDAAYRESGVWEWIGERLGE